MNHNSQQMTESSNRHVVQCKVHASKEKAGIELKHKS